MNTLKTISAVLVGAAFLSGSVSAFADYQKNVHQGHDHGYMQEQQASLPDGVRQVHEGVNHVIRQGQKSAQGFGQAGARGVEGTTKTVDKMVR